MSSAKYGSTVNSMRTLVEATWTLVIFAAFLASLHALTDLGATPTLAACLLVALFGLLWATWHTHWKS